MRNRGDKQSCQLSDENTYKWAKIVMTLAFLPKVVNLGCSKWMGWKGTIFPQILRYHMIPFDEVSKIRNLGYFGHFWAKIIIWAKNSLFYILNKFLGVSKIYSQNLRQSHVNFSLVLCCSLMGILGERHYWLEFSPNSRSLSLPIFMSNLQLYSQTL